MPNATSAKFKEILNYDDYKYVVKSEVSEPLHANFPNLPNWYEGTFNFGRFDNSTVISFEYKGSEYRLLSNSGWPDCNDGTFGALFDSNDAKVVDLKSTGDCETTIESLKNDDVKLDNELQTKLKSYLRFFTVILWNETEFEYLVFKILIESKCFYDIKKIDNPYYYTSDNEYDDDSEEDVEEEKEKDGEENREAEKEEDEEVVQSINKIHL